MENRRPTARVSTPYRAVLWPRLLSIISVGQTYILSLTLTFDRDLSVTLNLRRAKLQSLI